VSSTHPVLSVSSNMRGQAKQIIVTVQTQERVEGRFVLQVNEVINIAAAARDRCVSCSTCASSIV
jgi:hypothetical protein